MSDHLLRVDSVAHYWLHVCMIGKNVNFRNSCHYCMLHVITMAYQIIFALMYIQCVYEREREGGERDRERETEREREREFVCTCSEYGMHLCNFDNNYRVLPRIVQEVVKL